MDIENIDKEKEGGTWLTRIMNARKYEGVYRRQAYSAYRMYNRNYRDSFVYMSMKDDFKSVDESITKFSAKNNRSNIYYANIETLVSLVLPQVPQIKIYLSNSRNYEPNRQNQFYDVALGVLEDTANYYVKKSLDKELFKRFKQDHFITGRGVLWVNNQEEGVSIDHVHWLNYAQDPKLSWEEVRWVARRMYLSKERLMEIYPNGNFEDFQFTANPFLTLAGDDSYPEIDTTYLASGGKYAEVWEIWDKFSHKKIIASPQAQDKLIEISDIDNVPDEYFFPTPQPPVAINNGLDMRPTSELWSYWHELKQLNFINIRKEQLLKSMMLKGFISASNSDAIQRINNAKDGDIVAIQNFDPENPTVISYIDNSPKAEMLNLLTQEHEALKNSIYEITGISDQMRNISAQSDSQEDAQTATEVKTKTLFGSRRLREKQDVLARYLMKIYENVCFRIAANANPDELKRITSLNLPDQVDDQIEQLTQQRQRLMMIQQQMPIEAQETPQEQPNQQQQPISQRPPVQPFAVPQLQQPPQQGGMQQQFNQPPNQPPNQQPNQQQQQQDALSQLDAQLAKLRDMPTWSSIIRFLTAQNMSQLAIDVDLDDLNNLMGKNQLSQEQFMAASNLMQTMNNVIQMSMQNPEFVDVYCSLLEGNCDTSLYTIEQKRQIRDFTVSLKDKIAKMKAQPPQPPPPNPELIKAQAQMSQAQAKNIEVQGNVALAQARAQLAQVEAQIKMQEAQQGNVSDDGDFAKYNARMQELHLKHEQAKEKLQMEIEAANNRAQDKMATDTNLMKMKMQADDNRAREKIEADFAKERMKQQNMGDTLDNY